MRAAPEGYSLGRAAPGEPLVFVRRPPSARPACNHDLP